MIRFLILFYGFLLSLRYRVKVKNSEILKSDRPCLFLPNHTAQVDPQLLNVEIARHISVSFLVSEKYYENPVIKPFMKILRAISVPDLDRPNQDFLSLQKIFQRVTKSLQNGENIVLYPSGIIAGQGYEAILGKQSAYQIASALPQGTRIIGVRIRGLWGSMWSRAWNGRAPNFVWTYLKAIFYLLANFIFFLPRREVSIEFEDITPAAKKIAQKDLKRFNHFLENFYNQKKSEKPLFLKHFFYAPKSKRKLPQIVEGSVAELQKTTRFDPSEIDQNVYHFVKKSIQKIKKDEGLKNIKPDSHLVLDLYFDSLNVAEIYSLIKSKYPKSQTERLSSLKTVADLCLMAQGKMGEEGLKNCGFGAEKIQKNPVQIDSSKNIVQLFLDACSNPLNKGLSYDNYLGYTTRKSFLLKSIVVCQLIKKLIPQQKVGIMLPALQSAAVLIMACYFARKIPVMFNWTVGQTQMRHCMKAAGVKKILTVKTFFDTVKDQIPLEQHQNFIFLDQKVPQIKIFSKLKSYAISKISKLYFYRRKYPPVAVILFTSGSEGLPKMVQLTPQNIVSNLSGSVRSLGVCSDQIILSFLPPFHSFGFTITTILPLISPLRVVYTPSPTDTSNILKILKHTKSTLLTTTPTFLQMILDSAQKSDLKSLKYIITGAEACGESIFKNFGKMTENAKLIEGYGITECAPVITLNPPRKTKIGSVGKPIAGVEVIIIDLKTQKILPPNTRGMILVRGKNVFPGYADKNIKSPFVVVNQKNYYQTGDLGYLDEEGYVFISGRLKRFVKIAGEMVSLPFVEKLLLEKYGSGNIAVEGLEQGSEAQIVLFSTQKLNLADANQYLRNRGVSNLIKISQIKIINQIPLLGTGKTDYQSLKKMIV